MLYASLQPERLIVRGWEEQSLSGHNDKHSACPNDLYNVIIALSYFC
ncbi:hypothetical protein bcere0001_51550 [Bacillus cereus m1293]|nr:hypothetical protein bcere0001_51550 [Bacillus cereus m1293]